MSPLLVDFFLSHSTETFGGGTIQCFTILRLSKTFKHIRGTSRFSVEIFLSHSSRKIGGGTLLCFRNVLVTNFFRIIFREPFSVSKTSRYQNFLGIRSITILSNFFVSRDRIFLTGNHLVFHYFRLSKTFKQFRGISRFSVDSPVSQYQNFS